MEAEQQSGVGEGRRGQALRRHRRLAVHGVALARAEQRDAGEAPLVRGVDDELDGMPAASHFSQCAVTAGSMAPFSSIEVKPGRSG